jgi:hypothetical protein
MARCRHCRHGRHEGDCGIEDCGCVKFEPRDVAAREARKRMWIVRVTFLTSKSWAIEREVRVRAAGLTGAVMQGVRQARREALPPRTRVRQAAVKAIPVPGSARREPRAR